MQSQRFATHPNFTMTDACRLAHDLLLRPIHHDWSAPLEMCAVTAGALRAQLDHSAPQRPEMPDENNDDVLHPLVLAWRDGGGSDAQHIWYVDAAGAERRGISQHDLAWASVECITHFRLLSHFTPRPLALVVVVFEFAGQILYPIELRPLLGTLPWPGRLSSETKALLEAHACTLH